MFYLQILQLHLFQFHSFIFLLNIAVELTFFISSGSVFQRRAHLDMRELAPIVFVIKFGVFTRCFVHSSYFTFTFSKNFHMNYGLSSDWHL